MKLKHQIKRGVRAVLPATLHGKLRGAYHQVLFARAMRHFVQSPERCLDPSDPLTTELVHAWGNQNWSAMQEYLSACIEAALKTEGPVLECGSGLSTVLVGYVAQRRGLAHWALEQDQQWHARTRRAVVRAGLDNVQVRHSPIKSYGSMSWYSPPLEEMPRDFGLVLCDGPTGDTPGGRAGLLPVMGDHLGARCRILMDDVDRDAERQLAKHWETEHAMDLEFKGKTEAYGVLTLR